MDNKYEDFKDRYIRATQPVTEAVDEPAESIKRKIMIALNIEASEYTMFRRAMTKLIETEDEAMLYEEFQELPKNGKLMVIKIAKRLVEGNIDIMLLKRALKQMD